MKKYARVSVGLTGFDALQNFSQSSQSRAVLCNPLHNEIFANAFSKVKAALASAFRVPSLSMVAA